MDDFIIKVSIDLSCNLRVRNKKSNCIFDANELAEDHALIKSIQINNQQIFDGLIKIRKANPDSVWKLELSIGDKMIFNYSVIVSGSKGSVFFEIE